MQADAPVVDEYFPAKQPEQLVRPIVDAYKPDEHLEHELEAAVEYVPTAQFVQELAPTELDW